MPVEDAVYKINSEKGRDSIFFKQESGVYYLSHNSKSYSKIKKNLKESLKTGRKVKLKAHPVTLELKE